MATPSAMPIAAAKGGSFLLEDRLPAEIFTPEDLNEEQRQMAATAARFAREEIAPAAARIEAKELGAMVALMRKAAELGFMSIEIPEEYGGLGGTFVTYVKVVEEIAKACASSSLIVAVQELGMLPILIGGNEEIKKRFLPRIASGELIAAYALTEASSGSDALGSMRTTARRDGDDYVLNGSKLYITNGTQADWLCLLARTSDDPGYHGMSLIVVPTAVPGVVVSRKLEKLGMWSSDTAELSFTDVRVPVSHTIGEVGRGFQQQMAQFQAERLITFYKQVGSIELALERTTAYLRERKAFGAPLLANQHLQFVLAELSARHDVLKHYARTTADAVLRGEDATRYATIGKLLGSRLQREVADCAVQFHGGMGYMDENWTSRYFRDTRLDSIGAGADEVMLRILARMDGYSVGIVGNQPAHMAGTYEKTTRFE